MLDLSFSLPSLPTNIGSKLPNLIIYTYLMKKLGGPNMKGIFAPEAKIIIDFLNRNLRLKFRVSKDHHISSLDLSNNLLEVLPDDFGVFSHVYELDLSGNNLCELPNSFRKLTKLSRLNILGNRFISIPPEIKSLPLLKSESILYPSRISRNRIV